MKRIITLALLIIIAGNSRAQDTLKADTLWRLGSYFGVNFNQVGLTNWAGGGENSFSLAGIFSGTANYKKGTIAWDNSLDLGYGLLKSGDSPFRKNEDKIDLNSKFGALAKGKFYYSALLNAKSQFANGFNFPNDSVIVSRFAAPAFITIALGMDYKPNDFFSLFVSPATGKFTIVNDQRLADLGSFGVKAAEYNPTDSSLISNGRKIRAEFGASLRAQYKQDITKYLNITTTLSLFNNYTDPKPENRGNVDINWETLITIKAGKLITTSIYTNLIYDHDINIPTYQKINGEKVQVGQGPKTQFKEVIGVGISYKIAGVKTAKK
ncbi:MAG: DUF3078 domain-containing protein [Bacteroidia bacterium]